MHIHFKLITVDKVIEDDVDFTGVLWLLSENISYWPAVAAQFIFSYRVAFQYHQDSSLSFCLTEQQRKIWLELQIFSEAADYHETGFFSWKSRAFRQLRRGEQRAWNMDVSAESDCEDAAPMADPIARYTERLTRAGILNSEGPI